jgi:hypothetical protein
LDKFTNDHFIVDEISAHQMTSCRLFYQDLGN